MLMNIHIYYAVGCFDTVLEGKSVALFTQVLSMSLVRLTISYFHDISAWA